MLRKKICLNIVHKPLVVEHNEILYSNELFYSNLLHSFSCNVMTRY